MATAQSASLGISAAVTAAVRELDLVESLLLSLEAAIESQFGSNKAAPAERLDALQGADLARQMVADVASFLDEISAVCPSGPNANILDALKVVRVHDVRQRLSGARAEQGETPSNGEAELF